MSFTDDPTKASQTFGFGLCSSGKFKYDTRHAADRAARASNGRERYMKRRPTLEVYRCSTCHGWHLGHGRGGR